MFCHSASRCARWAGLSELERIGAIHQHLVLEAAARGKGRLSRVPRCGQCEHFAKGGSFGGGPGGGIPAAGDQQSAVLRIAGLAHAKFHLMTGLHPARAKCAANVFGSDNSNFHSFRLFDQVLPSRLDTAKLASFNFRFLILQCPGACSGDLYGFVSLEVLAAFDEVCLVRTTCKAAGLLTCSEIL